MRRSSTMRAMWLQKFKELRANGYDPYNSIGNLRLDEISISWRGL